jgi:hypothetical protein
VSATNVKYANIYTLQWDYNGGMWTANRIWSSANNGATTILASWTPRLHQGEINIYATDENRVTLNLEGTPYTLTALMIDPRILPMEHKITSEAVNSTARMGEWILHPRDYLIIVPNALADQLLVEPTSTLIGMKNDEAVRLHIERAGAIRMPINEFFNDRLGLPGDITGTARFPWVKWSNTQAWTQMAGKTPLGMTK